MILACPACSATFKIPDGAIPPEGRKVRCAKCKHSWHTDPATIARQQQAMAAAARPAATPAPAPQPRPAPAVQQNFDGKLAPEEVEETEALRRTVKGITDTPADSDTPKDDSLFDDDGSETGEPIFRDEFDESLDDESIDEDFSDGVDEADSSEEYDEDDFLTRRRADQRRQYEREATEKREKFMLFGWVGLCLFWLITFYVLVFEQERMVYKFPGMKSFYGFFASMDEREMYRPEEGEKLTPSKAEAEVYVTAKLDPGRTKIDLVNGEEKLVVQGYVENLGETGANVPQVLVQIVDDKNNVLDEWVVDPVGLIIRKNGRAPFSSLRDVPPGIANVIASVIEGSKSGTSGEYP